jgi:protein involved in polysaccharide export with SLBB domain
MTHDFKFISHRWLVGAGKRRRALIAALVLACCLVSARAQNIASDKNSSAQRPPTADTTASSSSLEGDTRRSRISLSSDWLSGASQPDSGIAGASALPADRLVEILQENPPLLANAKQLAATRMRQDGEAVSADAISDDELFNLIEQNDEVRASFTQYLNAQGYLTREDRLALADEGSDDDSPPVLSRGTKRAATPTTNRRRALISGNKDAADPNDARPIHKTNPYPDVQSLKDLYAQVPATDEHPKRFGTDIFRNRTTADNGSLDLPIGPDYVLGPGDHLNIGLFGGVSQRFTRTVDREGKIVLPESGTVVVAGKTLSDAQQLVQQVLTPYFHNVRADLSLTRVRTVRIYVVGEVQRPGAYDVSSLSTAVNALYAAGGVTARGSLRSVRHLRGEKLLRELDVYEFLLRGVRSNADRLEPGDTILVPPVGPQITVTGMVRRPAVYETKNEKDLADALDLAGGVLVSGALRQIRVERIQAHERRVMLSVDLPDGSTLQDVRKLLGPLGIQDGDRISIAPILPYSTQVVYLQGHVFRPGKYPYRAGMDVGSLLRSYQDVLPEPSTHAEVVRLQPPDFHPTTIEFNLGEILDGTDPIELQPFDTIRIYGRYEIDPPKVNIVGEVLRPGEYPLAEGMTAAALVRMAGGFKRSAFTETADVSSYVVQNGRKVETKHAMVEIAKALAGDRTADVTLKPGDAVSIRQLTGWKDIGASVVVNGEVRYPGAYGIEEGERLSSVLKRAGGFRPTAYPAGSMLERAEVREFEEKSRTELIHRIETAGATMKLRGMPSQEAAATAQLVSVQQQQVLASLRQQQSTGRLVIKITSDIQQWENTDADQELRAGDVITIPKRPNFVLVSGQVYSPAAIGYAQGKTASWYLRQAGGPTEYANHKMIFIIRANGAVLAGGGGEGWWKSDVLSTRMHAGDTLVVPEKIVGGSTFWKNLMSTAQLASSVAIAARIATTF